MVIRNNTKEEKMSASPKRRLQFRHAHHWPPAVLAALMLGSGTIKYSSIFKKDTILLSLGGRGFFKLKLVFH